MDSYTMGNGCYPEILNIEHTTTDQQNHIMYYYIRHISDLNTVSDHVFTFCQRWMVGLKLQ